MKNTLIFVILILGLFTSLFGGGLIGVAEANPGPATQIPRC